VRCSPRTSMVSRTSTDRSIGGEAWSGYQLRYLSAHVGKELATQGRGLGNRAANQTRTQEKVLEGWMPSPTGLSWSRGRMGRKSRPLNPAAAVAH
jgi:hypothetical protein